MEEEDESSDMVVEESHENELEVDNENEPDYCHHQLGNNFVFFTIMDGLQARSHGLTTSCTKSEYYMKWYR